MAAPLAPLAWTALRVGAVAATAYYVSRKTQKMPKDIWRERAMDETRDGIDLTADRSGDEGNYHGSARLRRVIRVGNGPGLEVDLTALGRIRIRRTD